VGGLCRSGENLNQTFVFVHWYSIIAL
jgi:hypothetical protein